MKISPAFRLLLIVAAAVCLSGCALTYYREKDGVAFVRISLGTDQQIGPVDLTGKTTKLKVGGVKTDQSKAAGAITGAAIEALKPHIFP